MLFENAQPFFDCVFVLLKYRLVMLILNLCLKINMKKKNVLCREAYEASYRPFDIALDITVASQIIHPKQLIDIGQWRVDT